MSFYLNCKQVINPPMADRLHFFEIFLDTDNKNRYTTFNWVWEKNLARLILIKAGGK